MYPRDWPKCHCGDFALDGHLTCGRAECDESRARDDANPYLLHGDELARTEAARRKGSREGAGRG